MSGLTRPATTAELAWIAPAATNSRVIESAAELVAIAQNEPWRVRVTEKGEAAVLARWRDHLDDCAVLGLWCSPRRVPVLITDLLEVARARGFARLLGPLVPETSSRPFLEAGLRVVERVVVMRLALDPHTRRLMGTGARAATGERGEPFPEGRVAGVTIREAEVADLADVLTVDAACFPPFWRYDADGLARLVHTGRVAVGTLEGRTVGYTLATSRAGDGSLGRLAVAPAARRRGIGRALVEEAIGWMARNGARSAILSTQEDNTASRSLYHGMGFRETGVALVACASAPLVREPAPLACGPGGKVVT